MHPYYPLNALKVLSHTSVRTAQTFFKPFVSHMLFVLLLLSGTLSWGQYSTGFEDVTIGGYAGGTFTTSTIQWSYLEVTNGNQANDYRVGTRSARFRNRTGSHITMNQNKTNGIGEISFNYRRYGTDSGQQQYRVDYSTDNGTNWILIGTFTPSNETVTTFSQTVNVAGAIRVRVIENTTPGGTGNSRWNLDELVITDYTTPTYNVNYNANGGTGAPSDPNSPYTSGATVTVLGPGSMTRAFYNFVNWNTAANGSGTPYDPGDTFSMPGNNVTLRAQWAAITDAVDWCNVQWPGTGNSNQCNEYNVYAQVYEAGLTDVTNGQAPGITAWIGYSTANTDPSGGGWTWVAATFNVEAGNNDEYMADLGAHLNAAGTYYYASRFQLNGGPYRYGGYNINPGNIALWDGVDNINGTVNVVNEQANFCNIDYPKTATIIAGDNHTVYAQIYEPGITDAPGQGGGIEAEIGYNTIGIDYEPWEATGWTWLPATYDSDANGIQNDQYAATFVALPADTYYYASRFRIHCNEWSYGGIQSDNVGNFWTTGTFNNGTLTVNNPPLADVVITEIMYNPTGNDDEWIEICNVSGSTQNLSGYIVRTDVPYDFTFPIGSFIADGQCITVSLGSNSDGTYNNPCPFTPDYGIGASTNNTNHLLNSAGDHSVQLLAPDGITIADSVVYNRNDGGNNNDATLHVIDIGLDNSNTSTNWQQVFYGGTPGINFLVSPCSPMVPKIDVERNTYASIPNGANPNTGHNTIWAATNVGDPVSKTFYVRNEGFAPLTIDSMTSSNPTDFTLDDIPASFPHVLAPGAYIEFLIVFNPSSTIPVTKNATITIESDDADENPYTFGVRGTAGCELTTGNLFPASGPVGTEISITTNEVRNLTGATATLSGVPLTILSSSSNLLVVQVPDTVTTGGALIVSLTNGCDFTSAFTLIDSAVLGCEGTGGANASDIFISQVTDSGNDSVTLIELYNGTGGTINLNNYSISLYNNGRSTPVNSNFTINLNNVNLLNGNTYVLAIGANDNQCPTEHNLSVLADQQYSYSGVSLNFSNNNDNSKGHDHLRLYNGATHIDSWGVYEDETWATTLNLGGKGANFIRRNDVTAPNTTFTNADWVVQDWGNTCADLDYSDIGSFDFLSGSLPIVSALNPPMSNCTTTSLSITASEGHVGGNTLVYQWYYNAPGETGWTAVPDNAIYDDVNTDTLQILDFTGLYDYQFYCEVRENDATCFVASNAIKIQTKTWLGTTSDWYDAANWKPTGVPTDNDFVVIGSTGVAPVLVGTGYIPLPPPPASAKSIAVQSGATLTIPSDRHLVVEDCVVNFGSINLENTASLVQINETNNNSGNGSFTMDRTVTNIFANNYIYWSSPIEGFDIASPALPGSSAHRYHWDPLATNDNGTHGNWETATGSMARGKGYIVRVPGAAANLTATFTGGINIGTPFNGTFTIALAKGTNNTDPIDNLWNLLGNPYPSAISADTFISVNAGVLDEDPGTTPPVVGTVYLWQHEDVLNATNTDPFYQDFDLNYYANNYVIYNYTGATPPEFNGNIASGQAFFVLMEESLPSASVTFTNAMRHDAYMPHENNQFLRTAPDQESSNALERHRIWMDLVAPNNTSSTILIGYVTDATNERDRLFDGYETSSTGLGFYSLVDDRHMGIQGRALPFKDTDLVPLGIRLDQTGTFTIAIHKLDGLFADGQNIYLEDIYTNTIHDMRAAPYTFTSDSGTYNDRFVLKYTNSLLNIDDATLTANDLIIFEMGNGNVKFSVGQDHTIKTVEIFDMLGRRLYNLNGQHSVEIYDLSQLSQAAYLAKVTLGNGQTISKRAVMRK